MDIKFFNNKKSAWNSKGAIIRTTIQYNIHILYYYLHLRLKGCGDSVRWFYEILQTYNSCDGINNFKSGERESSWMSLLRLDDLVNSWSYNEVANPPPRSYTIPFIMLLSNISTDLTDEKRLIYSLTCQQVMFVTSFETHKEVDCNVSFQLIMLQTSYSYN